MTDYRTRLRARGYEPLVIERTTPKPGERVMVGNSFRVANDRGGYEPLPERPRYDDEITESHARISFGVLGLIFTLAAAVGLYGAHGLGWL